MTSTFLGTLLPTSVGIVTISITALVGVVTISVQLVFSRKVAWPENSTQAGAQFGINPTSSTAWYTTGCKHDWNLEDRYNPLARLYVPEGVYAEGERVVPGGILPFDVVGPCEVEQVLSVRMRRK